MVLPNNQPASKVYRKAWLQSGHAFFISVVFVLSPLLHAECLLTEKQLKALTKVEIARVIDGDSVKLPDGQQLRLIGVNTPEMKNKQPLAQEAKQYLSQLLASGQVYLEQGEQQKDRYGRLLGHLYLESGQNIEGLVLEQGLGFLVAIPPNTSLVSCQKKARDRARARHIGVWAQAAYNPVNSSEARVDKAGFVRVSGTLVSITEGNNNWWLQLDGKVVLRIAQKHQAAFDLDMLKAMRGKTVVVSGWMIDRSDSSAVKKGYSPFMLLLTHPVHLEVQ